MEQQNNRSNTPVGGGNSTPAAVPTEEQLRAVESQLDLTAINLDSAPLKSAQQPVAYQPHRVGGLDRNLVRRMLMVTGVIVLIGSALGVFATVRQRQAASSTEQPTSQLSSKFDTTSIPLNAFTSASAESLSQASVLTINGRLVVNNSLVLAPINQPANGLDGQLYYDKTTNRLRYFNGTAFVDLIDSQTNTPTTVGGLNGAINLGAGLSANGGALSNTGVTSLQGQTGAVTFTAGRGVTITGTTISTTGIQGVTAGSGIAVTTNSDGTITVASTGQNGYDFASLAANGVVVSNGDGTLASVGSTAPGQCLVSSNGAPSWQACPGTVATGNVSTAGGTPGRIAKFSGTLELDDSLLSETGSTVNIAGDINLSPGFRFFIDGQQLASANLSDSNDLCKISLANCAPATGSFIQNGTVQQASANFNISGTGTAGTLNAANALQLGGVNINTAGTLSNVAYLNQNNSFTGNLSIGGSLTLGSGTVTFGNLTAGIVTSNSSGRLSSATLDRNSPTLLSGVLTVANGGTGLGMITANGLVYGNGTNTAGVTAAGTSGQLVIANASSIPTFVSVSGDIGISANGVVAIASGAVTNGKLANSSLTVTAGSNLSGGGLVALGGSITLDVASSPSFSGTINSVGGYQLNGSQVITSAGVLQNVTANANIITSGTLAIARGGTGLSTLPGNGQILIGNGSGYTLGGIVAGTGIAVTNSAGTITVSVDNTVCTTANNCMNPAPGSSYYIQNGTTQQASSNFNISGTGIADIFDATTALRLNGVSINTAGTLSNVAYLNQSNSFTGAITVGGNLTVTSGVVTIGSLGTGLVSSNASGVLTSTVLDRNDSSLLSGTLATGYGGTGVTGTATNGQLLIGNGSGYTLATLTGSGGITITNAAGAITVGLNNTVCTTNNTCESPPAAGSTNYIQNGTVQQASADFNISGGGTADRFNASSGFFINNASINTAGTLSNVAYLNQANTFSGNLAVAGSSNFTVGTGVVRFGGLSTGIVQSSATGVLSSSAVDRNAASFFSNTLSVANGGTGGASFTANGLLFGNGTGVLNVTAAGTAGQLLLANASGVPTFTSVSGDIAISANGVTTIANGVVSNAKLVNDSLTVAAGTNLTGGGLVALGGSVTLNVSSAPTFTGNVDANSFSRAGTTIITSSSVLQNVTANANIITSGTLPIARGGTGVTTLPGNGQLLIGNGSGYNVANLTAGSGVTITNAAGAITVSIDNSVCTTANNCPNPAPGSSFYIQNGTGQQTTANFNIDGVGIASAFNAITAYRLNGVDINDAGTLSNVAYLNQANAFGGNLSVTGSSTFTTGTGAVTIGSLGSGLVQANASGVLSSGSVSRNSSALFSDTLSVANGGTGVTATPTNGQLLIGNGSGYTLANLTGANGINITNAAGAITVALNNTVCTSTNPCSSPPAAGSTNYIQNGTVQQASADFNISGGGTANTFNAISALQLNGSNINTAGTLSNVAYLNQANTFAGNLAVATGYNFSVASGSVTFGGLGAGLVQANASGVLSSSQVDRNSSSLFSNSLSVANGGTGRATLAANGLLYGNGSGAVGVATAGTSGQLLLANASGVPTFTSVSGDIGITASGLVTIQNGAVTNAKLANSSITINSSANLVGGGSVALGGTLNLSVASSPSFTGTINAVGGYQLNGTDVITSGGTLQNVTTNANIVTSGTFGIARGGTGLNTTPTNGQLLIGNGSGYTLAGLIQGGGITITNAAGSITIAVDGTICTTANNCGYQAGGGGSGDYIQNTTTQQASANFNISGTGTASTINATTALQTAGVTRIDASGNVTAANVSASGTLGVTGNASFGGNIAGTNASATNYLMGVLGLGTTSPQSGDALTLANNKWISSVDGSGTGFVNILSVNANNEIQLGAALNVDGGILLPTDGGQVVLADMNLTAASAAGTPGSYTFGVGNTNVLTVYAQSDGAGSATNQRVAVGTGISPQYTLDVGGDINTTTQYRLGGNTVIDNAGNFLFRNSGFTASLSSGTLTANRTITLPNASGTVCVDSNNCGYLTTTAASTSYIQNTSTQQAGSNFNISGNGVIGGTLNVTGATTLAGLSATTGSFSGNVSFSNAVGFTGTGAYFGAGTKLQSNFVSGAYLTFNNNTVGNGAIKVNTFATDNIGFVVQGMAGQTGDLLQIQNSANNVLAGFGSNGSLYFTNGAYKASVNAGTLTGNRSFTLPDVDGVLCTTTTCAASGSGSFINNGTSLQSGNFFIGSAATNAVTARIQGSNGQSVDTFQVQDYQGNNFLSVSNAGNVTAGNQFTTGGAVGIQAGASTTKALQITTNATTQTGLQIDAGTAANGTNIFAAYGSTYGLTFNGAGVLNNTGSTTLGGTLNVSGASTIASLSATNGTFSGTLGVTGNTTIGGTLAVTGATTLSGNLTVQGTAINIGTSAVARTVNIGTGAAAQTVTIGSSTGASGTTVQGGSGGINFMSNGNGVGYIDNVGRWFIKSAADDANSFQIQNSSGTNLLQIDGSNGQVRINNELYIPNTGQINSYGPLLLQGPTTTNFTTPVGSSVPTKINIPLYTVPATAQILALGLNSSSAANARAISLFDARTGAHQPTISVFSPDESQVFGLSYEGSNTTGYLKVTSGGINLRSNTTDLLTANTSGVNAPVFNAGTGFQVGGAAASGTFLRGNGTNYVSSTLQAADLPSGSGNYIQNTSTAQAGASFNIGANGNIGGTLTVIGDASFSRVAASGAGTFASIEAGSIGAGTPGNTQRQIIATGGAGSHSIEIGRTDGVASTPFLDFHSGATAVDYDVRILATGGSGANSGGTLNLNAANVNAVNGNLQLGGNTVITSARVLQNVTTDAGIITTGTLGTARLSGSYTGITGVGTLGSLSVSGTSTLTGKVSIGASAGTAAAATIRGSGSDDIFVLQRSGGGSAFSVDQYANTTLYGNQIINNALSVGYGTQVTTAQVAISNQTAANAGLVLQGANSQLGNLLELRNNANALLANFNANGQLTAASIASNDYISATTTITSGGNITVGGFDFKLGTSDQSSRGNSGLSRALTKDTGNVLVFNYGSDYTGGTRIDSALNVSGATTLNTLNVTNGYSAGGTAGITVNCSAGQVLQGVTVKGGIMTGGTCVGSASAGGMFRKSSTQSIPTGLTPVTWETEVSKQGLTHSTSTNPSDFTIVTPGYYSLSGSILYLESSANQARNFYVQVNGVSINKSLGHNNADNPNSQLQQSTIGSIYYYLNAGDVVRVVTEGTAAASIYNGNDSFFSIAFQNANYASNANATNVGGTFLLATNPTINTNAETPIQWTNEANVSGLTHSTSTNAQNVTVVTPGYYLLSAQAEHINSANGIWRDIVIKINGVAYARGNGSQDSANTTGYSKAVITAQYRYLNAGDVITVTTQGLSGTTTLTGGDRTYLSVAMVNTNVSPVATNGGPSINNGTVTQSAANMNIQSTSTTTPTAVLRAVSGQTADALQIQDSNGNPLSNVAADGSIGVGVAQSYDITPTFTKLADPATLPSSTGSSVTYSPDSQYMAVATGTTPFLAIYKRSGDTYTRLADPAILPTGNAGGAAWSPDGQYLTIAHQNSPFITIYKRSGDTFTKLANPATLPASTGISTAWSPDSNYMVVGNINSPNVTIYKRSGDAFTKLADPATLPGGTTVYDTSWSPDGQYLAVSSNAAPYITLYKQSGDTFTKITNPASLPNNSPRGLTWSPDNQLLTLAYDSSPYIMTYKRSGDTFTKLADPAVTPTGVASDVSYSPDSRFLSVSSWTAPTFSTYRRVGDTFVKLADPASLPPTQGFDVEWAKNGQYITVGSTSSPYIVNYSVATATTATNTPTLANLTVAGRACIGTTSCNDTLGVVGSVGIQGFLSTTNLNVTNYLQTGGITRLDGSGNLVNINSITTNGNVLINNGSLSIPNSNLYVGNGVTSQSGTAGVYAGVFYNSALLGSSVGNSTLLNRIDGNTGNRVFLNQLLYRNANGTDWTSTSIAFQRVTDATNQSSLAFTGVGICINTGNYTCNTQGLGVNGQINASSSISANATPDIAEHIPAAPDVEAADVVMADPANTERVVRASGTYNSAAIGVISDGSSSFMINPYGGINGEKRTDTKPLVLAGRVPVKVTNENGEIKPGDHLTVSSTTGHAMKATRAGTTIGTALGFFNGTTGTVLVLVNPSYFDPFDGNNLQASTATISTLNAVNATITNLTVGTLNVTGNITVGGHIITAGNTPVITQNAALCMDTALTINGNDTAGEIVLTTGTGCANNGLTTGLLGSIAFSTPYSKAPRIVMTPSNNKAATLSKTFIDGDTITANGFNVQTLDTLAPGTTYRWYYHSLE